MGNVAQRLSAVSQVFSLGETQVYLRSFVSMCVEGSEFKPLDCPFKVQGSVRKPEFHC